MPLETSQGPCWQMLQMYSDAAPTYIARRALHSIRNLSASAVFPRLKAWHMAASQDTQVPYLCQILQCAGEQPCQVKYQSPKSVQIRGSPPPASPGLTPELCQLINAEVDVRRAASLDHVCDSSDLDTGDQLQVAC